MKAAVYSRYGPRTLSKAAKSKSLFPRTMRF